MMNTRFEDRWALPEVDTVFDFVFAIGLGAAPDGDRVAVTCRRPPAETRQVALHAARVTPISLHFESGYELRGEMNVTRGGDPRATGVYAKLSYDWQGQPPVQHFQGLVFLREAEPPPPARWSGWWRPLARR